MSRFKSAVHNIGHHAVSGLSNLLLNSYEACEAEGVWHFKIDLLLGKSSYPSLEKHKNFLTSLSEIKCKYEEVMLSTSGVDLSDVAIAEIEMNFMTDSAAYIEKMKNLEAIGVYYGHDPIYTVSIFVLLKNGNECCNNFSSES